MNTGTKSMLRYWISTLVLAAVMATAAITTISQINNSNNTVSPSMQYIGHTDGGAGGGG